MKLIIALFLLVIPTYGFAQSDWSTSRIQSLDKTETYYSFADHSESSVDNHGYRSPTGTVVADSITSKRTFITTLFYKNNVRLDHEPLLNLYRDVPTAERTYRRSRTMKLLGLLSAGGGVALGYVALRGQDKTALISGTNYDYTVRSVPKLLAGLGALVGGMCLIEFSNELAAKSANQYNAQSGKPEKISFLKKIKGGITPSGELGLYAHF